MKETGENTFEKKDITNSDNKNKEITQISKEEKERNFQTELAKKQQETGEESNPKINDLPEDNRAETKSDFMGELKTRQETAAALENLAEKRNTSSENNNFRKELELKQLKNNQTNLELRNNFSHEVKILKEKNVVLSDKSIDQDSRFYERKTQSSELLSKEHQELKELDEKLEKDTEPYYQKAMELSKTPPYRDRLETYTGHTREHISEVKENSFEVYNAIEKFDHEHQCLDGKVDLKTLHLAAEYHDVGMGIEKEKYKDLGSDSGDVLRKEHSLNSGLEVMKNKAYIEQEYKVNAEVVAFSAYLHSKSCSKVPDLNDQDNLKKSLGNFKVECKENNIDFKGDFSEQELKDIALTAGALRIADANRDGQKLTDMQGQKPEVIGQTYNNVATPEDEIKDAKLKLGEKEYFGPRYEKSLIVYAGEGNCKFDTKYNEETRKLEYNIYVKDPQKEPLCTQRAIIERFGEIDSTFIKNNKDKVDINIICDNPKDGNEFVNSLKDNQRFREEYSDYFGSIKAKGCEVDG